MASGLKKQLKVLVTCGPTWVPIDQVRVISNTSTGEMGHVIADAFSKKGAQVTLLQGKVTHQWQNPKIKVVDYVYFNDLLTSFKKLLKARFDVVVHAAAVSDFTVKNAASTKLDSGKSQVLHLTPTVKLIDLVKKAAPNTLLVGFKLESSIAKALAEAKKQLVKANVDLVVANCSGKKYTACLVDKNGKVIFKTSDKKLLAAQMAEIIQYHLSYVKK